MTNKPILEKASICAAGGILWRGIPFNSDIAVIHRTRYGDEWCLPKGKYDKEKDSGSLENTALREIQEETGCNAQKLGFATFSEYMVKGIKKEFFIGI
jgi:8-oxo-dGTP pyrophosphatase MutT (NUDIX family)